MWRGRGILNWFGMGVNSRREFSMSNEEPTRLTFKTGNTWLVAGASLFLLVGLWGTWAWVKWGGKDAPRDPTEQLVYFGFALLATVIIVPGVLLHIRKIRAWWSGVLPPGE